MNILIIIDNHVDQNEDKPDYSNEPSFFGQLSTERTLLVPGTVRGQGIVNLVVLVILVTPTPTVTK